MTDERKQTTTGGIYRVFLRIFGTDMRVLGTRNWIFLVILVILYNLFGFSRSVV